MGGETVVYPEGVGIAHSFPPARMRDYPPWMVVLASHDQLTTHPIRLNLEFRCDLAWWREFFTTWDGVSFFRMPSISSQSRPVCGDRCCWVNGFWGHMGYHLACWSVAFDMVPGLYRPSGAFSPRRGGSCVGSSLASVKGTVLV